MVGRPGPRPLVTIITATFNSRQTLSAALRSVRSQEFRNYEALVIGDACTDGSEEVVHRLRDDRFRWLNLGRNSGGQWGPNNEGLTQARGSYIAFLGHDDLWFPWHLRRLLRHLTDTRADLVHSMCPLIGPEGVLDLLGEPRAAVSYDRHFVPPSCWVLSRELALRSGPWPDPRTIARHTDAEMLRRFALSGANFSCLPEITMLKFPSGAWRLYDHGSRTPQHDYVRMMRKDPHALVAQVLLGFAKTYSRRLSVRYLPPATSIRDVWKGLMSLKRTIAQYLANLYGWEREPLRSFLIRRAVRRRALGRVRRGLSQGQTD